MAAAWTNIGVRLWIFIKISKLVHFSTFLMIMFRTLFKYSAPQTSNQTSHAQTRKNHHYWQGSRVTIGFVKATLDCWQKLTVLTL